MQKQLMVELLSELAVAEGFTQSPLKGVKFIRSERCVPRTPIVYEPSIVIVAQGRKTGYLGGEVYTYDPYNYLVLSVPLPFECETEGTPEKPLLAISLQVDQAILGELLVEMGEEVAQAGAAPRGIYSTPLPDELTGATIRLLQSLRTARVAKILGEQIVREIIYRVLCGEQGGALRAVASRHSRFSQIAKVLRRIHTEYRSKLDVEVLAKEANMSVSTFHHNFKSVTSTSPLQYLKCIRLHKARLLMVQEGYNASTAADNVGYESASQFSREYKRYFGDSPTVETTKVRGTDGQ
jgi:AraC-like DNA-binding protein